MSFVWSTVSENVEPNCCETGAVGWVNGDFKVPSGDDKGDGLTGVGAGPLHAVMAPNPTPSKTAMLRRKNVSIPWGRWIVFISLPALSGWQKLAGPGSPPAERE